MPDLDIVHLRLHNQHLAGSKLDKPDDVVRWLGAVQSQDYPATKWALGLRLRDARDADVEEAFNSGAILRTHVMRPTWHFVTPEDIRWLVELTAPRVNAFNAYMYRKLELDGALLARSSELIVKTLEGGKHLTRAELGSVLQGAGIDTQDSMRLGYIVHRAELDAVVCSGPRRGKQFTYALMSERAPQARSLPRDEALAGLVGRYFTGHGPATVKDFTWWSGLTAADARAGIEMVGSRLIREELDGRTYWLTEPAPFTRDPSPTAYLLPNYDEYGIGYADRSAGMDPSRTTNPDPQDAMYIGHVLIIDGQFAGTWRRMLGRSAVTVQVQTFAPLTEAEQGAVARAAEQYGEFLGLKVVLV